MAKIAKKWSKLPKNGSKMVFFSINNAIKKVFGYF